MPASLTLNKSCPLLLSLLVLGGTSSLLSAQSTAVPLSDSISVLSTPAASGLHTLAVTPINPEKPTISRTKLTAAEKAGELDFEVALSMRDFAGLQARLAKGEQISPAEIAAKYDPLATDYDAVVAWLSGQGFTITHKTPTHLAVFAKGTLAQIEKAMQVNFAGVSFEGVEYPSAISAPYVPAALASKLIGINGLQPYHHYHKGHGIHTDSLTSYKEPYLPSQILAAYQGNTLTNAGYNGAGQTIAIVIDTFPRTTDLTTYWSKCGVSQSLSNVTFIQVVSGKLPKPDGEETLDTEWASTIAPGAKVRVYGAKDLTDHNINLCYIQIYDEAVAHPSWNLHEMSMSYGSSETDSTHATLSSAAQYFAHLASVGVTIFASAGDNGADDANNYSETGLIAENPASDPSVTGVGGTSLVLASGNVVKKESVWDDYAIENGSTGGGLSRFFARPSWQRGTGVPSGTTRLVPDVAAPADPQNGAYCILNGKTDVEGGTSWSSPTWAGFCAILNQYRANQGLGPLGILGPHIYPLIGTTNFRDITIGDNAYDGYGYKATVGFDLCTGVGVPNLTTLARTLAP